MGDLKLGKLPATEDRRDLKFATYLDRAVLPKPPVGRFGHDTLVTSWGMLGNDRYGDCVFAGAAHETMLWNIEGGHPPAQFSDEAVLSDYSAVTGFRADDPSSDQGTNVRDALKYRQRTGIVDANGKRHRIGAYVALTPGDPRQLWEAIYLFGAVGVGIEFPDSAMTQFDEGKVWRVVSKERPTEGHYIPTIARKGKTEPECVTWSQLQRMTLGFYEKYTDEAWAVLSLEMLRDGVSMEGFDLPQLKADLAAL